MTKLNSFGLLLVAVMIWSAASSAQSPSLADLRLRAMGETGMGIGNDAGLLWKNPAEARYLGATSCILARATFFSNANGLEGISNFEENFSDIMNFKMDAADRTAVLQRMSEYTSAGPATIGMAGSPLGIVGKGGGWSTIATNSTTISSDSLEGRLEVTMDRNFNIRTTIGFAKQANLLDGTLAWGFGIPASALIQIHESAIIQGTDKQALDQNNAEAAAYGTYTDAGYAIGLDVGVMYDIHNARIGVAVHDVLSTPINWKRYHVDDLTDITPNLKEDGQETASEELEKQSIPADYTFGLAYTFDHGLLGFFDDFKVAGEMRLTKDKETVCSAGAETEFLGFITPRCGIDEAGNLCYGCGVTLLKIIECNYASFWTPRTIVGEGMNQEPEYENVQGVSVAMKF